MSNRLSKLFVIFSLFLFSLVFLLFLVTNNYIWFFLYLFFVLFFSGCSGFKHFGFLLFIISFVVRLLFIVIADFPQFADFETLLSASKMFALGDYSFSNWWHFHTWGYQTGFVIYQGFILKFFNSVFFLKVLNVLYSSCLVLFVYFFGKRISSERSARVVSLFYMIYPFHIFMDTILANHHLATLLMYLGILFLVKKDKVFKDYIVAGVLIALGNIIRPEGIIVVASCLIFEFFLLSKKSVFSSLVRVFSFVFVYFLIGYMASFAVIKSGVNPSGLKNNDPLWKFILGFNYESCGYYVDSDSQYQFDRETELAIIKERAFGDLSRTGKLMLCKVNRFWLDSGFDFETGVFVNRSFSIFGFSVGLSSVLDGAITFNNCVYLFIFVLFILGLFVKRGCLSNESLFLLIMCVVTFFAFLLIEIQPRYAYFIQISIFILASSGIDFIFNRFSFFDKIFSFSWWKKTVKKVL